MTLSESISSYVCPNGHNHAGIVIDQRGDFQALDCTVCGFVHAVPLPTSEELAEFYQSKFYESDRKVDYFEAQAAQKNWWHELFGERLAAFEEQLGRKGRVLDLGCGPGFFLAFAKEHGWEAVGIEPSEKASAFACDQLGLTVHNQGFETLDAAMLGQFDVVYSHGVIEHLQSPKAFVDLASSLLDTDGLLFINCANDFNPFQKILRETQDYPCWWFVPPEHLNYFTVSSLGNFVETNGFTVVDRITSFPIDIFLLMGDNYVETPAIGKECHKRRVAFEAALEKAGRQDLKKALYKALADLDLGRQIDLIARKN